jgi:hypothetical protein
MSADRHPLENLADRLGERVREVVQAKTEALATSDGRPLFTMRMPDRNALAWWQMYRFTKAGEQEYAMRSQQEQMQIDEALSRANAEAMMGPDYG